LVVNNIFVGGRIVVKGVVGHSLITNNLYWDNQLYTSESVNALRVWRCAPLFGGNSYDLLKSSPARDAGLSSVHWLDQDWSTLPPSETRRSAPDLGAFEQ
jgi:hypothetical protein